MWRFHASRNPVPTTTTHNTVLEIAWTIIPILILVVIAIPSFRLLYYGDKAQDAAMTVKVTGHQWYWSYEYPDQGNFSVDSRILPEADRAKLKPNQPRMLAVDEEMVIPANTVVRIIGTAADSMHGWTVWGFGIKKTVIPGRLNEGWIEVPKEGIYFGQCSQICGKAHSYMPIAVRVVSKAEFDNWVAREEEGRRAAARVERRFRRPSRQPLSAFPEISMATAHGATHAHDHATTTTTRRPAGALRSTARTTRTSARCTWCSPSSPPSSAPPSRW